MADGDILINFVLDKSGSMETVRSATISGFNEFKLTQKNEGEKLGAKTLMSLTLFDTVVEQRYTVVDITDVPDLTSQTYAPGGMTALYDAVGGAIRAVEARTDLPSKVLFVIMTDGQENSSREWQQKAIFDLITEKRAAGWDFAFLGADQDAYVAGGQMAVPAHSTMSYASADTYAAIASTSGSTTAYRTGQTSGADFFSKPKDPQQPTP